MFSTVFAHMDYNLTPEKKKTDCTRLKVALKNVVWLTREKKKTYTFISKKVPISCPTLCLSLTSSIKVLGLLPEKYINGSEHLFLRPIQKKNKKAKQTRRYTANHNYCKGITSLEHLIGISDDYFSWSDVANCSPNFLK